MLYGGHLVKRQIRHIALTDAMFSHFAHRRGRVTVYLRLIDAKVPASCGPSTGAQP